MFIAIDESDIIKGKGETYVIEDDLIVVDNTFSLPNIYRIITLDFIPPCVFVDKYKYRNGDFILNLNYNPNALGNDGVFEWTQAEMRRRFLRTELVMLDNYEFFIENTPEITAEEKVMRKMVMKSVLFDYERNVMFRSDDTGLNEALSLFISYGILTEERKIRILSGI